MAFMAGGQPLPGRIHLPGPIRKVSALSIDVYIASPFPRLTPAHFPWHLYPSPSGDLGGADSRVCHASRVSGT